jgi:hypothetical protein
LESVEIIIYLAITIWVVGDNTPGEVVSGEEGEEVQAGYEEGWYDEDLTQYDMGVRYIQQTLSILRERIELSLLSPGLLMRH